MQQKHHLFSLTSCIIFQFYFCSLIIVLIISPIWRQVFPHPKNYCSYILISFIQRWTTNFISQNMSILVLYLGKVIIKHPTYNEVNAIGSDNFTRGGESNTQRSNTMNFKRATNNLWNMCVEITSWTTQICRVFLKTYSYIYSISRTFVRSFVSCYLAQLQRRWLLRSWNVIKLEINIGLFCFQWKGTAFISLFLFE